MPRRPNHIPDNVERSALQKMSATEGLPEERLHPARGRTIAGMVAKGWIEGQLDPSVGLQYRITLAGEAALKAPIPINR
jgi:hypothetical protein